MLINFLYESQEIDEIIPEEYEDWLRWIYAEEE